MKLLILCKTAPPQLAQLRQFPSVQFSTAGNEEAVRREAPDADAILLWDPPRERQLLELAIENGPRIRWVHNKNAGVDRALSARIVESDVVFTNASGVFADSLAEWVIGSMLHFAKDVPRLLTQQRARIWEQFPVKMLKGSRALIFGYGGIGRAVAERALSFGMSLTAFRKRPELSPATGEVQVQPSSALTEHLPSADYLVLTAPLTAETRGVIGANELALLPPHAVLINVGRGALIDEEALVAALRKKQIQGAALDVFTVEPLPAEHPFFELPNVLVSPHSADHTARWNDDTMELFADNVGRFLAGDKLLNVIRKEAGY